MNIHSPSSLLTELWEIIKKPVAYFVFDSFVKANPNNFKNSIENILKNSLHMKAILQETPNAIENRELFVEKIDIQNLMRLIVDGWSEIFIAYPPSIADFAKRLLKARNEWAHQKGLSFSDVEEIIESSQLFLVRIGTPSAKKARKRLRQLLRHDYFRHILLPRNHIPQYELLEQIKQNLFSQNSKTIALHGMGGIGKTVLVRGLCDDPAIQNRFPDGILWMSFGEGIKDLELRRKLGEWIRAISGQNDATISLDMSKNYLAELLKDRSCLLVLDDVWQKAHLHAFEVMGEKCCTVITSRDSEIVRELGAKIISVPVMPEATALDLLEKWSQGALAATDDALKRKIVHRLGCLPLALKLAGAQLQSQNPITWLKRFDTRTLEFKRAESPHDNLQQTFDLSFSSLSAESQKLFAALSIFKVASTIPEAAISRLWQSLGLSNPDTTEELARDLASRALCEFVDQEASFGLILHPLVRDFLRHKVSDAKALHQRLLASYEKTQTGIGWHTVPDDAYFYQHLAYHFKEADELSRLSELLFDYPFLQAKLNATSVDALLMDYDLLIENPAAREVQSVLLMSLQILENRPEQLAAELYGALNDDETYPEVKMLRQTCYQSPNPDLIPSKGAYRLKRGARLYVDDGGQARIWQYQKGDELSESERNVLARQFRLMADFLASEQQSLFTQRGNEALGLESSPSNGESPKDPMTVPGTAISFDFNMSADTEHQERIDYIGIWENYLVSASKGKLLVWDWQTENILNSKKIAPATSATIHLSEEIAATLLEDSLCIWHLQTGAILSCARRESENPDKIELSDEVEIVILEDFSLEIRNPRTTQEISRLEGHSDHLNAISLYGNFIVSVASDHMTMMWNWKTGETIAKHYTANSQTTMASIAYPFMIVTGDENGQIHFLKPNPALLRLLSATK